MSDEALIELCTLSFEGCFWWLPSSMLRALETLKTWVQCALAAFASKLLTRSYIPALAPPCLFLLLVWWVD